MIMLLLQIGFMYLAVTWSFDAGRNYAGYCIPENRILSDEEMVRRGVEYIGDFDDVDKFLEDNPNCCSFGNDDMRTTEGIQPSPDWVSRMNGTYAGNVRIRRAVKYLDRNERQQEVLGTDYVFIKNCGTPYRPYAIRDY